VLLGRGEPTKTRKQRASKRPVRRQAQRGAKALADAAEAVHTTCTPTGSGTTSHRCEARRVSRDA
jgi:hypothetical protein